MPPRFLKLADVCEVLNISLSQAYALVNSGDLPAIQVGGRKVWRVEASELETYIQRMYRQTRDHIERESVDPVAADPDAPDADDLRDEADPES
ncbi:MAG TPA: helix-turn-helix domain-containing protein [Actinotalea sp.]|nr:helix-turn-helix domain-containing protein [Actinotalea sp.]